jgi:serine/threonine protein phosphatase 1
MLSRTIAIGDVHGCARALATLVGAVQPTTDDTLIPLGDVIDRGPDSRGVLEQLIALGPCCRLSPILGNHEEMLLAARSDDWSLRFWLACGGVATLDSYRAGAGLDAIPAEHWNFLGSCRRVHETETHVFSHAREAFRLPSEPEDDRPLWPLLTGKVAVVGHAAQKSGDVLDEGSLVCIDTYCHGGGWLTALEVHTGQVWQANERGELRRRTLGHVPG